MPASSFGRLKGNRNVIPFSQIRTYANEDILEDINLILTRLKEAGLRRATITDLTNLENRPSHFHAFKVLELNTNSSKLAGRSAYTLIGTYELHSFGLQKLMEVGTIIGDKVLLCPSLNIPQSDLLGF